MFSWTGCPFCKDAKALLNSKGAKYKAVELNTMDDGNAIRAQLAEVGWPFSNYDTRSCQLRMWVLRSTVMQMTNRTSMPNVFISGKSYGGCNDGPGVTTLDKQGKLVPLLKQAGAL